MKKSILVMVLVCILGFAATARAEWHFGLGTGLTAMRAEGDMGFNVAFGGIGPVTTELSLEPSDVAEYMKTAFGFAGLASDGNWMINYGLNQIEMGADPVTNVRGNTVASDISFKATSVELAVGYPFYRSESMVLRLYTGLRYLKHEIDTNVVVNGVTRIDRDLDNNWTDVLAGISGDVPLAKNWVWNTRMDAGFFGSEGSLYLNTGVNWRFAEHWSTGLFGQYYAIEFENGSAGDSDWYLYDVDESCLGLTIAYVW
jgi:hypothetical protein